jgi:branched-chain amino acid aminotransferase
MDGFGSAVVWMNGQILSGAQATVPVWDRGFLFGESVYETFRTYEGIPWLFVEHYERLVRSADQLSIRVPYSMAELWEACLRLAEVYRPQEAYLRIIVTGGLSDVVLEPPHERKPNVVILGKVFQAFPALWYETGAPVVIARVRRNPAFALDPRIKSSNLLNNILAYRDAVRAGAAEAIMLNYEGWVAEGASSNVFIVNARGVLQTPSLDVGLLEGVTRRWVLQICRQRAIPVEETRFALEDLRQAREVFVTSSLKGILPVTSIDGQPVGNGTVGPVTRQLMEWYDEAVRAYVERVRSDGVPPPYC